MQEIKFIFQDYCSFGTISLRSLKLNRKYLDILQIFQSLKECEGVVEIPILKNFTNNLSLKYF